VDRRAGRVPVPSAILAAGGPSVAMTSDRSVPVRSDRSSGLFR
jgi:hypothetical protein